MNNTNAQWDNIPEELRYTPKWVIAGPDKAPYSPNGHRASVTQPATWRDFYSASTAALSWGAGVGFVLSEEDPFTCIDLDVKDTTTQAELERYWRIVQAFDSYTEFSRSGRGIHIWIKGKVGLGARREGVEVYSQARYIICTGMPVPGYGKPIEHRQEMLDLLLADIRNGAAKQETVLVEQETDITDDQLWERATGAGNAEKFNALWTGDWQGLGYTSQSEADLSLLSMLCFYSKSNEQVRRVFRFSGLGKRDKATKNDTYLNRTLKVIRSRQRTEDASRAAIQVQLNTQAAQTPALMVREDEPVEPARGLVIEQDIDYLEWPPGPAGVLAQWMHAVAPRPVREVAIVSTLGFLAGVYGKSVNIPNSGLNLYIVLVARSAIGKEAMHSSISKLVNILSSSSAMASSAVDFSDFASGPALVKAISGNPCFVNVAGEWGRKMKRIALDQADGAMSGLRTVMTNLYQKSAADNIVGGIGYSDKEKNIASISGVAYSMIGETTPDTFYEALTNTMMQDGFMSRFIVVEYNGKRPPLNPAPYATLDHHIIGRLVNDLSCTRDAAQTAVLAQFSDEALNMMHEFDLECDEQINSTEDESWRQMWNRAHLKAMRVASVLASFNSANSLQPYVTEEDAEWAIRLIRRDIKVMTRKMQDGDVGDGDGARERKLMSIMHQYVTGGVLPTSYGIPDMLRTERIVPRAYLQIRTTRVNSFTAHRNGANFALDQSLKSLADSGYIVEVPKVACVENYGYHGKSYRVMALPRSIVEG